MKNMATAGLLVFMVACAGKAIKPGPVRPAWVNEGMRAVLDKGQKAFYGIGAVAGIENKSLGRMAADNRARTEIAGLFKSYMDALMQNYQASISAGNFSQTGKTQAIEEARNAFSELPFSHAVILDHWTDPSDGVFYSLARMDLEGFKDTVEQTRGLDADVRAFVNANADQAFETFDTGERGGA